MRALAPAAPETRGPSRRGLLGLGRAWVGGWWVVGGGGSVRGGEEEEQREGTKHPGRGAGRPHLPGPSIAWSLSHDPHCIRAAGNGWPRPGVLGAGNGTAHAMCAEGGRRQLVCGRRRKSRRVREAAPCARHCHPSRRWYIRVALRAPACKLTCGTDAWPKTRTRRVLGAASPTLPRRILFTQECAHLLRH